MRASVHSILYFWSLVLGNSLELGASNLELPHVSRALRKSSCLPILLLFLATAFCAQAGDNISSNAPTVLAGSTLAQEKINSRPKNFASALPESAPEASPVDKPIGLSDTNNSNTAPEPGFLPTPGVITAAPTNQFDQLREFQIQLDLARRQRREKSAPLATKTLVTLLETNAPPELKRQALFELALVKQDDNQPLKAQQIFAQYLQSLSGGPHRAGSPVAAGLALPSDGREHARHFQILRRHVHRSQIEAGQHGLL